MDLTVTRTAEYLKSVFTPADLRHIADLIAPAPDAPGPAHFWDRYNILRSGVSYVLGATSGGECVVCSAVIQRGPGAAVHAGWHNDQARRTA